LLLLQPVDVGDLRRVVGNVPHQSLVSRHRRLAKHSLPQRNAAGRIVEGGAFDYLPGDGLAHPGHEMQTAGFIGALASSGTHGATVAFFDQPDLQRHYVRTLHRSVDKFDEQEVQRPFLGHLQQQLTREVGIEPPIGNRLWHGEEFTAKYEFFNSFLRNIAYTIFRVEHENHGLCATCCIHVTCNIAHRLARNL